METNSSVRGVYQEVPMSLIDLNTYNARNFEGMSPEKKRSFDELVNSIRQRDLIQPITVRPKGNGRFEVVAGERRFRAKRLIAQEAGTTLEDASIQAVIRTYSDQEAEEVMLTENALRDDLTPMEEAKFFTEQIAKMGNTPDTVKSLAKTYGLDETAIRLRVALYSLPPAIQKALEGKTITIGHAELFCKISDVDMQTSHFNSCVANRWTIKELNTAIKNAKPPLKWAKFDTEPCQSCLSNSGLQRALFDTDMDSVCLDPACFRKKQFDFFDSNWQDSKGQEIFKTNGFRFHDDLNPAEIYPITTEDIHSRCQSCPDFVTAGSLSGGRVQGKERVCIGSDRKCYDSCYTTPVEEVKTDTAASREPENKSKEGGETETKTKPALDKATQQKRLKERAKQRGISERESVFKKSLPVAIEALEPTSPPAIRLALAMLLLSNSNAVTAVQQADHVKENTELTQPRYNNGTSITRFVVDLPKDQILLTLRIAGTGALMADDGKASPDVRMDMANLAGLDLRNEWTINEDYLKKQTKEEIVALGEQPEIALWDDEKIKSYKKDKFKNKGWMSLKKQELIDCILKSGADLSGKLPAEIEK